ncbi:TetR/AcrR family transcriptional regulator [Amycolatopsis sp. cg5]|uniref:TetR/AcrR family transcriptional regulator n=1 Tax=Amycolatopsis sp. cg5 TaxID=3238802 RepID=UPI0035267067
MAAGTAEIREDTRTRLLTTALRLFTEHGVEGTSLQMIADALGVTKAAVYYHFKTKDEITEAVAEPGMRELAALVEEGLKVRRRGAQIDFVLEGFVDLVVRHRSLVALFSSDPGIARALERGFHTSVDMKDGLITLFVGEDPDVSGVITAHVLLTGLALTGGAPTLADLDDETLRASLLEVGRKLLGRRARRIC